MGTKDFLVNMDYLALAIFQSVRTELLASEQQIECLQVFMDVNFSPHAPSVIRIAERVKKVTLDKQEQRHLQRLKQTTDQLHLKGTLQEGLNTA